jgi:hypothetical protein
VLSSGSQIPRQMALALVGLTLVVAVAPGAHATQAAPCEGDETIAFAPPAPVVGQPFVAAVSSRREHVGLWLSGPVASYEAHQWSDELGFVVWQFSFTAEWPGRHDFTN